MKKGVKMAITNDELFEKGNDLYKRLGGIGGQDARIVGALIKGFKLALADVEALKRNHFTAYQVFEAIKALEQENP